MAPISGFVVFCLVITLGYLVGLLTFITDHEENRCEMTYMFEYPQFVRIHLKADLEFKKYALYVYSEGYMTKRARDMHFDGIPLLFIPGNAGSYKQVRSLASVALRKSQNSRPGFHFDFFTVDLNDELSGLNGALLDEQTMYVNQSINRILELYEGRQGLSKSIVLIGHSMGGIIARGLLTSLPQNSTLIPLVITLAAPHARPPVVLDNFMQDYYHTMRKNNVLRNNSTVISLSGGYNDFLVQPFVTYTRNFQNLHVVSTAVPLTWLPVDHLCILWCKQLVLATVRGLFDSVNFTTKQLSLNAEHHRAVFQHHLVMHSGIKLYKAKRYQQPVNFSTSQDKWIEKLQRHYTVSIPEKRNQTEWHMIRLFDQPNHEYLTVLAIDLEVSDWIFACPAIYIQGQRRICMDGMHLSHLSQIAPSIKHKRRKLILNMFDLKKNYTRATHVVIRVPLTDDSVVLHVDIYGTYQRQFEVNLPRWWSFTWQPIIPETGEKVVHYELVLPQLQHIIQSYKLYVEPLKCTSEVHHATATLSVPWTNHDVHSYITETKEGPLDVRLYSSRPHGLNNSFATVKLTLDPACTYSVSVCNSFVGMLGQIARTYSALLIANATAVILLSFRNQLISIDQTGTCSVFFDAVKQGIKPYYILTMVKLASRVLSWKSFTRILPTPDWQLIAEEGNDFFLLPLLLYMCSVGIVWLGALGLASSLVLCESTIHKLALKFLAHPLTGALSFSDWLIRGFHKLPCFVATVLVFLSFKTCGALALCLGCGFYFLKLTQMSQDYVEGLVWRIIKYLGKKLKRKMSPQATQNVPLEPTNADNDLVDRALENGAASSGRLADVSDKNDEEKEEQLELMDEDMDADDVKDEAVPESSTSKTEGGTAETDEETTEAKDDPVDPEPAEEPRANDREDPAEHSAIFFHFSIFLLWFLISALNIPYVLTWAHNFKYSAELRPDPSFFSGLVLSVCAIPLWQLDLPKPNRSWYVHLGQCLNLMAAASLIYAPLSVYRLEYIITGSIVMVTLHQLLAPEQQLEQVTEEVSSETMSSTPDTETLYETVKAKWE